MKSKQESSASTPSPSPSTKVSLTKALAAAATPQPRLVTAGPQVAVKHQNAASTDHVIQTVGEKQKAFEMTCRFFCYQVATSSISNIIGTVIGHPLDTIRVRMQIEQGQTSFLRTCSETFQGEGVRGFFKGLVSPVVGVTPYNVLVFTVTEALKKELGNRYEFMTELEKSFISGSIAGGLALVIYNPVELLKVRAQINRVENMQYRKAIPVLIHNEGFFGLYKGIGALMLRDVPGWGVYFWSYELLKSMFGIPEAKKNGTDNSMLNMGIKMWCGGVAGQASWVVSYPYDIIKTQIQINETRRVRMLEVVRRIYAEQGMLAFFKGMSPTLARSFVVNALTLPIFERLNDKYCYGPQNELKSD